MDWKHGLNRPLLSFLFVRKVPYATVLNLTYTNTFCFNLYDLYSSPLCIYETDVPGETKRGFSWLYFCNTMLENYCVKGGEMSYIVFPSSSSNNSVVLCYRLRNQTLEALKSICTSSVVVVTRAKKEVKLRQLERVKHHIEYTCRWNRINCILVTQRFPTWGTCTLRGTLACPKGYILRLAIDKKYIFTYFLFQIFIHISANITLKSSYMFIFKYICD